MLSRLGSWFVLRLCGRRFMFVVFLGMVLLCCVVDIIVVGY